MFHGFFGFFCVFWGFFKHFVKDLISCIFMQIGQAYRGLCILCSKFRSFSGTIILQDSNIIFKLRFLSALKSEPIYI